MAKQENYSKEQTKQIVSVYSAAETDEDRKQAVAEIAHELGKSQASVRQKLVSLNVYVKPERKNKAGGRAETKERIVQDIAKLCECTVDRLSGIERGTKTALQTIREKLQDAETAKNAS